MHRWHRNLAAMVTLPLVFYAATGVLLNHRREFGYFQSRVREERAVARRDLAPLREFIAFYKDQIGRADDPAVIRIRDGRTVEFLYGSHGQVTYVIDPREGRMVRLEKRPVEPWNTLNRIHKAFKTPGFWAWSADVMSALMIASVLTGLLFPGAWRRSRRHLLLWGGGFAALLVGLAWAMGP